MTWLRRLSLEGKMILVALLASLASAIVACALFILYDTGSFKRAMQEDLRVVAEGIAINSTPALEFESLDAARDILGALRAVPQVEMAVVYDRKGNSVEYRRADLGASAVPALSRSEGAYFQDGKLRIYTSVMREGKFLGTVFIESDTRKLRERSADYARVGLTVLLASLLIAFALASLVPRMLAPAPQSETDDVKSLIDVPSAER